MSSRDSVDTHLGEPPKGRQALPSGFIKAFPWRVRGEVMLLHLIILQENDFICSDSTWRKGILNLACLCGGRECMRETGRRASERDMAYEGFLCHPLLQITHLAKALCHPVRKDLVQGWGRVCLSGFLWVALELHLPLTPKFWDYSITPGREDGEGASHKALEKSSQPHRAQQSEWT